MNQHQVKDYYEHTILLYRIFWHGKTNALHYGFWDADTKSHRDALINTNRFLARIISPNSSAYILDAGCGVGGSSVWLAKNFGAHVSGITLSPAQKKIAEKNAKKTGVNQLTHFSVQDYRKTNFLSNYFSSVWGIESVCHAENKKDFLKEAYRVLKPGGKIVVADGFLSREPQNATEEFEYRTFLKGFSLPNLTSVSAFKKDLMEVGFKNIQLFDKTPNVKKTSEYMYTVSKFWLPFFALLRSLRLIPYVIINHMHTGIIQKNFFSTGVGKYYVFSAEK